VVKLAPKAVIKTRNLSGSRISENIYMEARRIFDVAHTKTKPFTVHDKVVFNHCIGHFFQGVGNGDDMQRKNYFAQGADKVPDGKLKGWKQDIILLPGNEYEI